MEADVGAATETYRGPGRRQELRGGCIDPGIIGQARVPILRHFHTAQSDEGAVALETGTRRRAPAHSQGKARRLCHASSSPGHRNDIGAGGRGGPGGDSEISGTGGRTRRGGEGCARICGQPRGGEGHGLRGA